MEILHTLERHAVSLEVLKRICETELHGIKFVLVAIDPPESVNRQASWASDFNAEDTHKLFQALADQTRGN